LIDGNKDVVSIASIDDISVDTKQLSDIKLFTSFDLCSAAATNRLKNHVEQKK
jgi:hypothetical protein